MGCLMILCVFRSSSSCQREGGKEGEMDWLGLGNGDEIQLGLCLRG